ncbi:LacI family transcriptional regulator [Actinomycetaceae bacterium TAE3-ERU4]|nr:LacI family transcriptional regulator [Actinomycetaceae bacterium TAE3-ERU4]
MCERKIRESEPIYSKKLSMKASPKRATIADVAREAGVSITTISRVLNNRGPISETTREAVQNAMQRLGYRPNSVARSLRTSRTNTIAIIFPSLCDPYYLDLMSAVECELVRNGMQAQIYNCCVNKYNDDQIVDSLLASRVDGVILGAPIEYFPNFPLGNIPLVTVAQPREIPGIPNIKADNTESGARAANHFAATNCKRAVLLAPEGTKMDPRRKGFRIGANLAGLEVNGIEIDHGLETSQLGKEIADALDNEYEVAPFQGIFTINDFFAPHIINWSQSRGMKTPEDMQIIGFDGSSFALRLLPDLSTFRQPFEELARLSVEVLGKIIAEEEIKQIEAPAATFIKRHTTLPVS